MVSLGRAGANAGPFFRSVLNDFCDSRVFPVGKLEDLGADFFACAFDVGSWHDDRLRSDGAVWRDVVYRGAPEFFVGEVCLLASHIAILFSCWYSWNAASIWCFACSVKYRFFISRRFVMARRNKMGNRKSRRDFRVKSGVHPRNNAVPMRGGIRL